MEDTDSDRAKTLRLEVKRDNLIYLLSSESLSAAERAQILAQLSSVEHELLELLSAGSHSPRLFDR